MSDAEAAGGRPNVVFFHVDNLGYGELGCYGGGVLRGADTRRLDQFAAEGYQLLNYAPEAQCSPTRSALLTGRYAIRSGNQSVPYVGSPPSGLVAWERTQGDLFAEAGYATMCLGKWHVGNGDGRWPTDHGLMSGTGQRVLMWKPSGTMTRGMTLNATRCPTSGMPARGRLLNAGRG